MARITWQLLTEQRTFESIPPSQKTKDQAAGACKGSPVSVKGLEAVAISKPLSLAAPINDWLVAEA